MDSTVTKKLIIRAYNTRTFDLRVSDDLSRDEWGAVTRLVKQLPERRWRPETRNHRGFWMVPSTPLNVAFLTKNFAADALDLDDYSRVMLEYTTLRESTAEERKIARWKFVFEDELPKYEWQCKRIPFRHQIVAVHAALGQEFFAQLMEQGTGKTLVSIEEMVALAKRYKAEGLVCFRALWIVPLSVRRQWLEELQASVPDDVSLWCDIIPNGPDAVDKIIEGNRHDADLKVWIINHDRVCSDFVKEALILQEFDMVGVDEATAIKNPAAKRTKAIKAVGASARMRRILTGTIMANTIFDVYAPYEFLSEGALGYSSFEAFKRRYGEFVNMGEWAKLTGYKNLDELKERMATLSFLVTRDQCLDLPPRQYQTITVDMGERQREIYDSLAESAFVDMDLGGGRRGSLEAATMFAQLTRFAQITGGYLPLEVAGSDARVVARIPGGDAKFQAALELVQQATGKVILWCRFKEDIRYMRELLEGAGFPTVQINGEVNDRERNEARIAFNTDPAVRCLVGEPGSGGIGLTLLGDQSDERNACRTMIYVTGDWSLLKRSQSEDRNYRIGQTGSVMVYDIVCRGSIDETIAMAVRNKKDLADALKNVSTIRDLLLGGKRAAKHIDEIGTRRLL